ncbi:hypothetical protein ACE6H2_022549 [Prunus campanulata]
MSTDETNFSNNMLEDTSKPSNDNILEDTSKAKSDIRQKLHGAHEDASQQSQKDNHVQGEVVGDKQELEAGDHEPVKAIDDGEVVSTDNEASLVEIMDDDQVANEEPISENKEEDLTSCSDDQDPAKMLPHDQQLPEDPQVTYEGGAASGTPPNTPSHSSPSVDSALAGGASPGVDAQADLDQYYSLISSEIPFSSLLGNESSSFVPSGSHHNQHYFQQILYSQFPTMAQENNNNNTRTNPRMLFPLDQTPIRNLDGGSGSSVAFGSQNMHRQSNTSHMMVQPQLDNGNTAFMRSTNQPSTIFGGEDLHFQRFFQSQAAGSFGGQQIPQLYSIPAQQHGIMARNFAGGHPYPVAEVPRTPRMTMNNWEDNINMVAPTPNLHVPNRAHWSTQLGQASQGPNYGNNIIPNAPASKPIKNSLYDPMYEAMGLPVDPHLRLFLGMQRRNNGA